MPGPLLDANAQVLCAHGAQASALMPSPRVQAAGAPVVVLSSPFVIAGCPFVMGVSPFPCVSANFITGALRVTTQGQPALLKDSVAIATPTGAPLSITTTQVRVQGQ